MPTKSKEAYGCIPRRWGREEGIVAGGMRKRGGEKGNIKRVEDGQPSAAIDDEPVQKWSATARANEREHNQNKASNRLVAAAEGGLSILAMNPAMLPSVSPSVGRGWQPVQPVQPLPLEDYSGSQWMGEWEC
ncbi:hypothetical protein HYALB_00002386 [Hymenoscyphus albidus]|uniref:Uncharacterized protein n=1 Tax=Hymenoscyphus albidus TaxID=595503 RepID=A0A9N9LN35_9HELO|nr:hypothetical protein HYALB_00002386 [Hymenoscyphus albidus]